MPLGSILAFWGVAALLIVVPGVDWAFAINAGLRRQVLPAAAGIVLGYLLMTAVVAAGLGALITSSPVALTALTVIGALYLIWLGTTAIRTPGTITTQNDPPPRNTPDTANQPIRSNSPLRGTASLTPGTTTRPSRSNPLRRGAPGSVATQPARRNSLLRGIAVSTLNPKGLLVFVTILPRFADPRGSLPMPVQLGCLGLAFVFTCALVYPCVGLTARILLSAKPVVARIVSRVSGVAMILIGVILLGEQICGIVQA